MKKEVVFLNSVGAVGIKKENFSAMFNTAFN